MMFALAPSSGDPLSAISALVCNGMPSLHSKRAYDRAIKDFLGWCRSSCAADFTKATLQEYRSVLEARALSASTINLRICAIRKLAVELADNGVMPQDVAAA